MESFSWRCPYCNQPVTITAENYSLDTHTFDNRNKDGALAVTTTVIVCPNRECREYQITAYLFRTELQPRREGFGSEYVRTGDPLVTWKLKPQSAAMPIPDFVPKAIVDDYNEACAIVNLSPKASATLSRRCLQGIIRDFWKIKKATLYLEIDELKDKVDSETWKAIDAVRRIGNIGAHMETDINVIVDVEPHEAEALKELIELLIEDTYIVRHDREQRLKKVVDISVAKDDERKKSGKS